MEWVTIATSLESSLLCGGSLVLAGIKSVRTFIMFLLWVVPVWHRQVVNTKGMLLLSIVGIMCAGGY